MLELYLSRNVRKQKQFATYVSFLDARCPLPDCVFSVYEQDRDENLYSRFPLKVNIFEKTIDHLENVTCAACSADYHLSVEEFDEIYRYWEKVKKKI